MIKMGPNAGNHNSDPPKKDGDRGLPFFKTEAYRRLMAERTAAKDKIIPEPKEVPGSEAIAFLRSIGTGWDVELERLLAVPGRLFHLRTGPYTQYSSTDNMDMGAIFQSLRAGGKSFSTGMEYGFMVYDSASATHFLLFDAKRRIVVRDIVQVYDEDGGQSWAGIKQAMLLALKRAGGETAVKEGLIAVYDRESYRSALAKLETVQ
jgi:hypothetical protein